MHSPLPAPRAAAGAAAVASLLVALPAGAALASAPARHTRQAAAPGSHSPIVGVVVAEQRARHAVVLASRQGTVETLRVRDLALLARLRPGVELRASASRLGDGTYRVSSLRTIGWKRFARVRGTVVRSSPSTILLSAGGSVISLGRRSSSGAAPRSPHILALAPGSGTGTGTGTGTGSVVSADLTIDGSSLLANQVQPVGQSDLIDLEGVLSSVTASQIVLAVDNGASTTISVPASLSLPAMITTGDRVEVLVYYSSQSFSLVTISDETAAAGSSGSGASQPSGTSPAANQSVQAEGSVVSVDATSLVVQPGEGAAAVTFAVPAGFDLTGITAGSRVDAVGTLLNGVLTLQQVAASSGDSADSGGAGASAESVEGSVVELSQTTLVVQGGDGAAAVSFEVPAGFDLTGVAVGAHVKAFGTVVSGVLTLQRVTLGSGGGSSTDSSTGSSGGQSSSGQASGQSGGQSSSGQATSGLSGGGDGGDGQPSSGSPKGD